VTSFETGDSSVRERVTRTRPEAAGSVGSATCSTRHHPEDEDEDEDDDDDDDEEEEDVRECSTSCST